MKLVERDRAMQLLSGVVEDAADGSGRLVLVSGEAGVGKSALVTEFLSLCDRRVRVLAGACDPVVTPRPLGPLVDIAHAVGGDLADLIAGGSGAGPVLDALLRESAGTPLAVVVLEDLHWADEATLGLLCVLGRRVGGLRALVIATYRDDDLGGGHPLRVALGNLPSAPVVQRLPLSPLSEAGVGALVAGRRLDVGRLYRVTGGNPFYLTELLAAEGDELPMTVRDAVLARMSRLSAEGRTALEVAAAFGRPVDRALLKRLGVDAEPLDECVLRGLVRWQQSKVEFRHELVRSAVLGEQPPGRAAAVHGRILAELRAVPAIEDPAELAWHAEEAADAAAVLEYAPVAALEAERLHAHREAAAQYARTLRFADSLPAERRAELAESCSREAVLGGRVGDAIAAAQTAIALRRGLGEELAVGAALAHLADLVWHTSGRDTAVSLASEAVALLERLPPGGVLECRCVELTHRGRWRDAGQLAQALLAEPGLTLVDRIQPLYVLGRLRARRGDAGAWAPLDEALDLCAGHSELQYIGNVRAARAEAAWLTGDRARVIAEAQAAYPLAVPVGDPWILGELALWLWRGDAPATLEPVLAEHPYGLQIAGDWTAAAAGWEQLGCPFEQAAALLDSGEVTALRLALQIFDQLGARPAAAMAARRLRALGERGVPRGVQHATREDQHQLTRRQQQILALLGEGLTDAEIADRLFLSAKTVSNHVSAVLAKLGVRSRAQAIAHARNKHATRRLNG